MDRHPDDNDKKPRSSQAERPRKPGDRPGGGGARGNSGGGRAYAADKGARPPAKPARDFKARDGAKSKDGKGGAKPGMRGKDVAADAAPLRSERIAKAMARAGIASRREVERLIGLGKVAVNGRILETPATLVTRDDKITVDGKPIGSAQSTRLWRYNKPVGLLTSNNDPGGRPTIFDALPTGLPRTISVGRLDINTEGLLLLTNDGELSRALELPDTALVRQYRARARGRVTQTQLDTLKEGVTVDGVRYGSVEATIDKAKVDEDGVQSANLWISVSITEGKNREVRKVLESIGLTVNRLIRLAYGPFQLGTLPLGSVEEVGPRVIRELLAQHIRPENLPTGNSVETPAPIPGRRTSAPILKGSSGSAMSDPSRKPSRVRAAETASAEAIDRNGRPAKKPTGWAKAAPRSEHPKRTFKPRARPEAAGGDVRPDRKPRDYADKVIGPKSESWAKDGPRGAGDKTRRDFKGGAAKPRTGGARPSGTSGQPAGASRGGPRPSGPRGPRSGS